MDRGQFLMSTKLGLEAHQGSDAAEMALDPAKGPWVRFPVASAHAIYCA